MAILRLNLIAIAALTLGSSTALASPICGYDALAETGLTALVLPEGGFLPTSDSQSVWDQPDDFSCPQTHTASSGVTIWAGSTRPGVLAQQITALAGAGSQGTPGSVWAGAHAGTRTPAEVGDVYLVNAGLRGQAIAHSLIEVEVSYIDPGTVGPSQIPFALNITLTDGGLEQGPVPRQTLNEDAALTVAVAGTTYDCWVVDCFSSSALVGVATVNEPFNIELLATAEVSIQGDLISGINYGVSSRIGARLGGSAVLDLPPGLTANSLDGSVIDNQFVGVVATPEPSTALLLGLGLIGLAPSHRRNTAAPAPGCQCGHQSSVASGSRASA